MRRLYEGWREELLACRALLEADIDFADEDDVPGSVADSVALRIVALQSSIAAHLGDGSRSAIIRDGYRVALIGRPNVGKSSLLNRLAGSELAIVSDEPGTTRDVIEARLDIGGHLVIVSDTAGLRETGSLVEAEGIRRAMARAEDADLVLHLDDENRFETLPGIDEGRIVRLATKSDLGLAPRVGDRGVIAVSSMDPSGIAELIALLTARITDELSYSGSGQALLVARERHVGQLKLVLAELDRAAIPEMPVELRAEALRSASTALAYITGAIGVEDVLGAIFASFCIGK